MKTTVPTLVLRGVSRSQTPYSEWLRLTLEELFTPKMWRGSKLMEASSNTIRPGCKEEQSILISSQVNMKSSLMEQVLRIIWQDSMEMSYTQDR